MVAEVAHGLPRLGYHWSAATCRFSNDDAGRIPFPTPGRSPHPLYQASTILNHLPLHAPFRRPLNLLATTIKYTYTPHLPTVITYEQPTPNMRFAFFSTLIALLAAVAMAVPANFVSVIISFPNGTPDSVVDAAKAMVLKTKGKITHEYSELAPASRALSSVGYSLGDALVSRET